MFQHSASSGCQQRCRLARTRLLARSTVRGQHLVVAGRRPFERRARDCRSLVCGTSNGSNGVGPSRRGESDINDDEGAEPG